MMVQFYELWNLQNCQLSVPNIGVFLNRIISDAMYTLYWLQPVGNKAREYH